MLELAPLQEIQVVQLQQTGLGKLVLPAMLVTLELQVLLARRPDLEILAEQHRPIGLGKLVPQALLAIQVQM